MLKFLLVYKHVNSVTVGKVIESHTEAYYLYPRDKKAKYITLSLKIGILVKWNKTQKALSQ